jgi:hypothetical protein
MHVGCPLGISPERERRLIFSRVYSKRNIGKCRSSKIEEQCSDRKMCVHKQNTKREGGTEKKMMVVVVGGKRK